MKTSCIVMAGGGTGGHVFPMIAVADALKAALPSLRLVFVGTPKGLESSLVPKHGYELTLIDVLPLRGGGVRGVWRGASAALSSTFEQRRMLRKLDPRAVFSIGGYAAGPVAAAARSLSIPVAVMEPNSVIGLSNRLLAPFVQRAYTVFEGSERYFPRSAVLRTGVPIRLQFQPRPFQPSTPPNVLVLGGSQGAVSLNETLPKAFARLGRALHVVHQTGRAHSQKVAGLYAQGSQQVKARVVEFIDDMPEELTRADLVISRSGAGAVSEICAVGRASLLIPYPYAAGDHQKHNALALVRAGAAVMVDGATVSEQQLAHELAALIGSPQRLARMAESACRLGRPNAARVIASDLIGLAGLATAADAESAAVVPEPAGQGPLELRDVAAGRAF